MAAPMQCPVFVVAAACVTFARVATAHGASHTLAVHDVKRSHTGVNGLGDLHHSNAAADRRVNSLAARHSADVTPHGSVLVDRSASEPRDAASPLDALHPTAAAAAVEEGYLQPSYSSSGSWQVGPYGPYWVPSASPTGNSSGNSSGSVFGSDYSAAGDALAYTQATSWSFCLIPMWSSSEYVCDEHTLVHAHNTWDDSDGVKRKRMELGDRCTLLCPEKTASWSTPSIAHMTCEEGGEWWDEDDKKVTSVECSTGVTVYILLALVLAVAGAAWYMENEKRKKAAALAVGGFSQQAAPTAAAPTVYVQNVQQAPSPQQATAPQVNVNVAQQQTPVQQEAPAVTASEERAFT